MNTPNAEAALLEFEKTLWKNLHKNGYPAKTVAFPIDTLYEAAATKGLSFNKVRARFEEQGVFVTLEDKRVVFSDTPHTNMSHPHSEEMPAQGDSEDSSEQTFARAAASLLDHLTPEQMAQMRSTVEALDPSQLSAMRSQLSNMSDEERAQLLEQMRAFMAQNK